MSKQLKKTEFLNAIPNEATSVEQISQELTNNGFEFLPSYVDYLTEHFIEAGRVARDEDGNIYRVVGGGASSKAADREVFEVRKDEDGYTMVKATMRGNPSADQTVNDEGEVIAFGWAITPNAAMKKAASHVFANYKAESAAVKELLNVEPTEAVYGQVEDVAFEDEDVAGDEDFTEE